MLANSFSLFVPQVDDVSVLAECFQIMGMKRRESLGVFAIRGSFFLLIQRMTKTIDHVVSKSL